MTTGYFVIDPEVQHILQELAADPSSTLLRSTRPAMVHDFLEDRVPLANTAASLTSSERHLVQAYRSEAAHLLREACKVKLICGADGHINICPYRSQYEPHPLIAPDDLASRCQEIVQTSDHSMDEYTWVAVLEKCVRAPLAPNPSVVEMAEVSLRLEPTDEARIMAALDMIEHGKAIEAIRCLRKVLSIPASANIRSCTWNNLGMAYTFLLQMEKGYECYGEACSVGNERLEPWMNRLLLAIQLGHTSDAHSLCRAIDDLIPRPCELVDTFVSAKRVLRQRGSWRPSNASRITLGSIQSDLGVVSGSIASVFY